MSNRIQYHIFRLSVVNPVFRLYFRGRIYGREKIPNAGPLVVVSNHASFFDPPFVGGAVRRPVAFMAKEELFTIPILGQWIRLYGAYPVNRASGDRGAIRAALGAIDDGWATGLFLDGTRTQSGKVENPKLGAAMIAAKAKATILPVSLWGTEKILSKDAKFPSFVPVTVRFGDPLPPPSSTKREELETITQKCTEIINAMHELGR